MLFTLLFILIGALLVQKGLAKRKNGKNGTTLIVIGAIIIIFVVLGTASQLLGLQDGTIN